MGQKESSWAWVKLGQAHFDSESNRAKESRWVGTFSICFGAAQTSHIGRLRKYQ